MIRIRVKTLWQTIPTGVTVLVVALGGLARSAERPPRSPTTKEKASRSTQQATSMSRGYRMSLDTINSLPSSTTPVATRYGVHDMKDTELIIRGVIASLWNPATST